MPKLSIVIYSHNHGFDALAYVVPDGVEDTELLGLVRKDLEDQFGAEEVAADFEQYGGLEIACDIPNGEGFTWGGKRYAVRIAEIPDEGVWDPKAWSRL